MAELPEGFYAVGVDATAKQERGGTVVAVQEVPVELVAGTAVLRGLGVEEVVVAQTIVGRYGKQVLGSKIEKALMRCRPALRRERQYSGASWPCSWM